MRGLLEEGGNEAVRVERFHVVDPFAEADELHRQAELLLDGEHRAALRRAVELREDDAGALHRLRELLGLSDGVLAGGGVEHQQHLVRGPGICRATTR